MRPLTAPASRHRLRFLWWLPPKDPDGKIAKVEFFQGTTLLATLTAPPYTTTLNNVQVGSYTFTARGTDNFGGVTTSDAVTVTVASGVAQLYFIYTDQLNTPRVITDQTNKVVWRWDNQDPFGANVPDENPSGFGTFTCNLRFPGQYFDRETNLAYNYYRDYSPDTGRYVESDPIGLRGGINGYGYVNNQPLKYVDPLGLVKYTGNIIQASAIEFVGATYAQISLDSECACGKRVHVEITAVGPSVGLGLKVIGSYSSISFDDHLSCPDPSGFSGLFLGAGAGITFGAIPLPAPLTRIGFGQPGIGTSVGVIRVGSNVSDPLPPGAIVGRDLSISGTIGSATVTSMSVKECCK